MTPSSTKAAHAPAPGVKTADPEPTEGGRTTTEARPRPRPSVLIAPVTSSAPTTTQEPSRNGSKPAPTNGSGPAAGSTAKPAAPERDSAEAARAAARAGTPTTSKRRGRSPVNRSTTQAPPRSQPAAPTTPDATTRTPSSGSAPDAASATATGAAATAAAAAGAAAVTAAPRSKPTSAGKLAKTAVQGKPNPRSARLYVTHIDPWSVMKQAFLLALALAVITMAAFATLWFTLESAGVLDAVTRTATDVGGESGASVSAFLSFSKVMGFGLVVAGFETVLVTSLATLFAFLYNIAVSIGGGIEVTLSEDA